MKAHRILALAMYVCLISGPILFAESDPLPLSSWYTMPVVDLFLDSPQQKPQPFLDAQEGAITTDEAFELALEITQEQEDRRKEKKRRRRKEKKKIIDVLARACYVFIECMVSGEKTDNDTDDAPTRSPASNTTQLLSSMITALQVTDEFYGLDKNTTYSDKILYQFYEDMLCQWEVLYGQQEDVRSAALGMTIEEYVRLSAYDKAQWLHSVIDNAQEANCLYEVFSSLAPLLPLDVVTGALHSVTRELTMTENRAPNGLQRFVYTNPVGRALRRVLSGSQLFSRLAGAYADSSLSRSHIGGFVDKFNIDMDEADGCIKSYRTFNQFFTRKLKEGARPVAEGDDVLAAPADGHVLLIDDISKRTVFGVKKNEFTLEKFLGDKKLAAEYEGGTMLIFRLAPWDYHRFHFPTSGTPQKWKRIKGNYESVHPIAYASGVQPLSQNERHLITVATDEFDDMVMVPVGALCVGRIKETYKAHAPYAKGDEAGYFAFGGSTVVMLFKPGVVDVDELIVQNSRRGKEIPVKMGEAIGRRKRTGS